MNGELPPYSEYKDSGVPWMGEVPALWEVKRLKRVCRFIYGDSLPGEQRFPGDVSVFGSNGRVGEHYVSNTFGPCIIVGRKGSFGKVNYSTEPVFAIDTTFYIDRRFTEHNLRWLYFVLRWLKLDSISRDSAVPGLDREEANQQLIPLPPPAEQAAIVRYLDHIDRRIRRYIRARRRLIALLGEQKQAIIHQAVTRGLDPSVPLKPSGVEWLGDVPAHWEVVSLRRYWKVIDCKHLTVPFVEDGVPLASVREVQSFSLDLSGCKKTTEQWYGVLIEGGRQPRTGDIIYCRNVSVGACALVESQTRFALGQDVCLIRSNSQNQRFLTYVLHSSSMERQLGQFLIGSTFKRINISQIKSLIVQVPPPHQQTAIVQHLDSVLIPYEAAIDRAKREIDLLREYRTRLIADVVTGKVDVRAAAAALPAEFDEPGDALDDAGAEDADLDEDTPDDEGEEE